MAQDIGLGGGGEDDENTINMCREILVEPLSNCSKLTYVRHEHAWEQFCLQTPTFHTKNIGCAYGLVQLNKLTRSFIYSTPFQKASHKLQNRPTTFGCPQFYILF